MIRQAIIQNKRRTFIECINKGHTLIEKGLLCTEGNKQEKNSTADNYRVEVAVNARYLHRGFYCPSLIRDIVISNSSRGRIVKRPTDRTNISHKYYFDINGKLQKVISYLPNREQVKEEYLVYEDNIVYGFSFDAFGALVGLSEEAFNNDKRISYFCASCYVNTRDGWNRGITEMFYETYCYDAVGLHCATYYHLSPYIDDVESDDEVDTLISRVNYQFIRKNGHVLGFFDTAQGIEAAEDIQNIYYYNTPRKL